MKNQPLSATSTTPPVGVWGEKTATGVFDKWSGSNSKETQRFKAELRHGVQYTQSDPIGLRGGVNLFTYVGQNPLKYVDPLGLKKCCSENDDCPSGEWYYTGNVVSGFETWIGVYWGTGIVNSTGTYTCIGRENIKVDVKVYCEVTHAVGFDIGWDIMEGWSWQSATGCKKKDLFTTTEGQVFSLGLAGLLESRPSGTSATDNSDRGWTAGIGISLGAGWAETTCVVWGQ